MAQTRESSVHSHKVSSSLATKYLKALIVLSPLAAMAALILSAHAQLQQPLVFSSAGAVASRNDQTGALTRPIPLCTRNQQHSLVSDL
jgi:hypothetical protein